MRESAAEKNNVVRPRTSCLSGRCANKYTIATLPKMYAIKKEKKKQKKKKTFINLTSLLSIVALSFLS